MLFKTRLHPSFAKGNMCKMLDLNNERDKIKFGDNLRKARTASGLTQDELAEKIGLSNRSAISQWECGNNTPEYGNLYKLCEILNIDVGYLMGDYSEKNYTVHHIKEITNLSERAIEKLLRITCTPYFAQVISALIENGNCEYYLAMLRSRFSAPAWKNPQDELLDLKIYGQNARIKSDGLIDSLFATHIIQDMEGLSKLYLDILKRNKERIEDDTKN